MQRFCPDALKSLAARIASAAGVPPDDAAILADSLVAADLSGTSTHGLSRLAIYVKRIGEKLINPAATLTIDRERAATISINANNGLGQVQAIRTLDLLIPK